MIPYVAIGIVALIGLFGWGLKGLIVGAITGYVFSVLLGLALVGISGGLLPRKVRQQTASSFIALHPDLVRSMFTNMSHSALQKAVEHSVESIFRRASKDSKSMHVTAFYDRAYSSRC
jgi:hypothetical protein